MVWSDVAKAAPPFLLGAATAALTPVLILALAVRGERLLPQGMHDAGTG